jgi:hypothetical protein
VDGRRSHVGGKSNHYTCCASKIAALFVDISTKGLAMP